MDHTLRINDEQKAVLENALLDFVLTNGISANTVAQKTELAVAQDLLTQLTQQGKDPGPDPVSDPVTESTT
jgi:hypothetical protein